jgi:hypothetical protein
MKWFVIFSPLAGIKLLLFGICVFTTGYLLAINVLIIELDDANGSKHKIASDPEHVYSAFYIIEPRVTTNEQRAKSLVRHLVSKRAWAKPTSVLEGGGSAERFL